MMHYNTETLDDYLHGELSADRDAAVHAHLEACADCRNLHAEGLALREWIRTQAQTEEHDLPSLVKARVWERVRTEPVPGARWTAFWRPLVALPVAAALAAVAYFGVPTLHPQALPAVGLAATDLLELHAADSRGNPLADRGFILTASAADGSMPVVETDGSGDGR